jgi:hypothetical protein
MITYKRLIVAAGVSFFLGDHAGQNYATPAPLPVAGAYIYVEDLDRHVGVRCGEWHVYGQFNAQGELMADGKQRAGGRGKWLPWMGPVINELMDGKPQACFELRSGRLIKGAMTEGGHFVPDLGSQVTKFEDYHFAPDGPRIWNLPGAYMLRNELDARRKWLAEHMAENPDAFSKEKARLDAAIEKKK